MQGLPVIRSQVIKSSVDAIYAKLIAQQTK
jgi:hypothetical protein